LSVAASASYDFAVTGTRTLVATFIALPQLQVTPGDGNPNEITLSWPVTASGWILQECVDCASWLPSGRVIVPVDGRNTVTIATDEAQRFFRLAHP
jgi:hypothetical protein